MAHRPVLANRVVEFIVPAVERGGVVVDATVGAGGHSRRILEAAPAASLVGIDRDPAALELAQAELDPHRERVELVRADFAQLSSILERLGIATVRGVLLDLGVSSPQLDAGSRGFSFRRDGPLDMRMDPGARLAAEEVVNSYDERDLARVLRRFGEERFARRIANAIVRARPVGTTLELAGIVTDAIPAPARRAGGHPARRTFQAIRIEVNDELGALNRVLPSAVDELEPPGRFVVISYHSLEDRAVKQFFASEARGCTCPPDLPVCRCGADARLRVLTSRPERPGPAEVTDNPRSRAAKLRAAERIGVERRPA